MKVNNPLKGRDINLFLSKYNNKALDMEEYKEFLRKGRELEKQYNIEIEIIGGRMGDGKFQSYLLCINK